MYIIHILYIYIYIYIYIHTDEIFLSVCARNGVRFFHKGGYGQAHCHLPFGLEKGEGRKGGRVEGWKYVRTQERKMAGRKEERTDRRKNGRKERRQTQTDGRKQAQERENRYVRM
jgi:hypothetical protein